MIIKKKNALLFLEKNLEIKLVENKKYDSIFVKGANFEKEIARFDKSKSETTFKQMVSDLISKGIANISGEE